MRCLLYLLALGRRSVDRPVRATPDLSVSHQMNNGRSKKRQWFFSPFILVSCSCPFTLHPSSFLPQNFLNLCRLILPMSMYIGLLSSLHHSLTLILPLKNTAFSGSEMPEGRNTDRTCHHDNGFCELPDTQTLLWEGW